MRRAARALRHATMPAAVATAVLLVGVLGVAFYAVFFRAMPFRPDGRTIARAPIAAALAYLFVHVVDELAYPRPSGDVRTADPASRTAADVAPRRSRVLTCTWADTLAALFVVDTLTATGSADLEPSTDEWVSQGLAYLDSFDAVPIAAGVVAVLLATVGVLHLVAARPAVSEVAPEWDLALRRGSAHPRTVTAHVAVIA